MKSIDFRNEYMKIEGFSKNMANRKYSPHISGKWINNRQKCTRIHKHKHTCKWTTGCYILLKTTLNKSFVSCQHLRSRNECRDLTPLWSACNCSTAAVAAVWRYKYMDLFNNNDRTHKSSDWQKNANFSCHFEEVAVNFLLFFVFFSSLFWCFKTF